MRIIFFLFSTCIILISSNASGQFLQRPAEWKYVHIHSTLPDFSIGKMIRYKDTTARLSDFGEKLIVFAFWFTSCSSCIRQFPKEDSLQRVFNDELQIIPVTYETGAVTKSFLEDWEKKNKWKLSFPCVVGDTLLRGMFQNIYNPYYVWMFPYGRVAALTGESALNYETVKEMIRESLEYKEMLEKSGQAKFKEN